MDDTTDCDFLSFEDLQALLPEFRLDSEPLSSTAMSRVYLASDTKLHDRKVAVKIMADSLAEVPDYRKRFLREIRLMADLEHPHIMYVIAAARKDDPLLYFVMPRAEADLRERLAEGALDPAETARVITQVAGALDFAHDRGVVHRDVKPANILFGAGDHVYLSDFGIAKHAVAEDLTRAGDFIGTRRYTSPEVYGSRADKPDASSDDPVGRSVDVYSLGAVLFHCLTGKRPFDELDDFAVAKLQQQGKVPRIAEIRPDLSEFDAIAVKAMSPDPAEQYRTCGELAAAVSRAAARIEDKRSRRRRGRASGAGRALALTAAMLVIGLVLGGILSYMAFGPDTEGTGLYDVTAGSVEPTVTPVTGDEQVERLPTVGECLTEERYVVVACDSSEATKQVYRIVTDPADPNPQQADHYDAAWQACEHDGIEREYFWSDSAFRERREWNPETDRIYYFVCYQRL